MADSVSAMLFVATFELIAGLGIVGLWTMLLVTRRVPEIQDQDRAIWFHLVAEYLLGLLLIASGSLLLVVGGEPWVRVLAGVAIGAMLYSTINSPGYYARDGEWGAVAGFGIITILGILAAAVLVVG